VPELIKLDEALDGVLDAVVDKLKAAVGPGTDLGNVRMVVRGDRSRPAPETPALWVRILTAIPSHERRTYAETWQVDVIVLAIVKSDNPEEGYREATKLAARARSEVLKDRSLGNRKYVQDVRSGNFEASGPGLQNESLFASTAVLQVHFVILEQNP